MDVSEAACQSFSLPSPLMAYIGSKANGLHFRKLYSTCKYFPLRYPFTLSRKFQGPNGSLSIKSTSRKSPGISKIKGRHAYFKNGTPTKLPLIILRNTVINDLNVTVHHVAFTRKEFIQLTSYGMTKVVNFHATVVNSDGTPMPLEDMLSCLPRTSKIVLSPCHVNLNTGNQLCSQPLNKNLDYLSLYGISGELNVKEFCQFFKAYKNFIYSSHLHFFPPALELSVAVQEEVTKAKHELPKMYVWSL